MICIFILRGDKRRNEGKDRMIINRRDKREEIKEKKEMFLVLIEEKEIGVLLIKI